jgi:hypothetical protein
LHDIEVIYSPWWKPWITSAAKERALSDVEQLAKEHPDVRRTVLQVAIERGNLSLLKSLLGSDEERDWDATCIAAAREHPDVRRTVLQVAIERGNLPLLKSLVGSGKERDWDATCIVAASDGSRQFLESEFEGQFTTQGLIEALKARGITVPKAPTEIESLNELLTWTDLWRTFPRIRLPKEARALRKRAGLTYEQAIPLNRSVLEAAYPQTCPKKAACPVPEVVKAICTDMYADAQRLTGEHLDARCAVLQIAIRRGAVGLVMTFVGRGKDRDWDATCLALACPNGDVSAAIAFGMTNYADGVSVEAAQGHPEVIPALASALRYGGSSGAVPFLLDLLANKDAIAMLEMRPEVSHARRQAENAVREGTDPRAVFAAHYATLPVGAVLAFAAQAIREVQRGTFGDKARRDLSSSLARDSLMERAYRLVDGGWSQRRR